MERDIILIEKIKNTALTVTIVSWSIVILCIPGVTYNNPVKSQSLFSFAAFDSLFVYIVVISAIAGIVSGVTYFVSRKLLD